MQPVSSAQVRIALKSLQNTVALGQCELAKVVFEPDTSISLGERARKLRSLLLEAIESLGPVRPAPFGSLESRSLDVLALRYVERLDIEQVARELSLSRRQVLRDLRKAEEALAEVVNSWLKAQGNAKAPRANMASGADALHKELLAFPYNPVQLDVVQVASRALEVLAPLLASRHVRVEYKSEFNAPLYVLADRGFLSQLLTEVLSLAIQLTADARVRLGVMQSGQYISIEASFRANNPVECTERIDALKLAAAAVGLPLKVGSQAGQIVVVLTLPVGKVPTLLIVEDNPEAVYMYKRYLADIPCEVKTLSEPRLCYETVRVNKPAAIILDIIMPNTDGWQVLHTLKRSPETAHIPVIVCSVLDDPDLAQALGATAFLRKPVSRAELLQTLSGCVQDLAHIYRKA